MRKPLTMAAVACLLVFSPPVGTAVGHASSDPDALWRIVSTECVPNQLEHDDPAPCAAVDDGSAVLKDLVGATQYLLIPTARSTGIEAPALLEPGAPNYFEDAWRARTFVDERAGWALPRDWVSLAINSAYARSQSQLHIHVDCVRADVRTALSEHAADVGGVWAPFPVPLAGHRYDAIAVDGDDLDAVNPFVLLADGIAGARGDMASRTLVAVGAVRPDGRPGFVILSDRADAGTGDLAEGEELQDHAFCPAPPS
ncbi:MAG: CDP-diacylglycerol diphosphatase [Mycobacterium sp.]